MFRVFAAILAIVVAVFFVFLSIDHDVYAPGAYRLHMELHNLYISLFGEPSGRNLDFRTILRKAYSIVAFGLVGVFVAMTVPDRSRRYTIAIAAVAVLSAIIEVVQKVAAHSYESFASNIFDVLCGAVGGAIGAFAINLFTRRLARR